MSLKSSFQCDSCLKRVLKDTEYPPIRWRIVELVAHEISAVYRKPLPPKPIIEFHICDSCYEKHPKFYFGIKDNN